MAYLHRFYGVMSFFNGFDFYELGRMGQQKLIDYLEFARARPYRGQRRHGRGARLGLGLVVAKSHVNLELACHLCFDALGPLTRPYFMPFLLRFSTTIA